MTYKKVINTLLSALRNFKIPEVFTDDLFLLQQDGFYYFRSTLNLKLEAL
jgi:hypothetical protein